MLERIDAARPHWIPAVVLLREIKERGYLGGITQLKEFLSAHRQVKLEPVVRFETAPGKQMQVDFTHIRRGRSLAPVSPRHSQPMPIESLQHPLPVYNALLEAAI